MTSKFVLDLIGALLSAAINHQDTTPEDKVRLQAVIDRMSKLESHEQDIADGKG